MSVSLGELAVRFGCELRGDPDARVEHVATLSGADPRSLSFLANPRYRPQLAQTRAGAVVLDAKAAVDCPTAALISPNPHAAYARIAAVLHPRPQGPAGVHPSAIVAASARIDPTAHIGALCVIGERATVGPRAYLGPHCVLEDDVTLAEDVYLAARVTLCHAVEVGARSVIQPGAVIGGDGFGFAAEQRRWIKVPQVGTVRIGRTDTGRKVREITGSGNVFDLGFSQHGRVLSVSLEHRARPADPAFSAAGRCPMRRIRARRQDRRHGRRPRRPALGGSDWAGNPAILRPRS